MSPVSPVQTVNPQACNTDELKSREVANSVRQTTLSQLKNSKRFFKRSRLGVIRRTQYKYETVQSTSTVDLFMDHGTLPRPFKSVHVDSLPECQH